MLPRRKRPGPDEPAGAPEWMVTFSDCMTLLLTFFVLLLSFSSFDEEMFKKLKIIFADALPAVKQVDKQDKDAFLPTEQIEPTDGISDGSEKATLENGKEDGQLEDTEPVNFRSRKVFLIPSNKVFWGKGTAISLKGRKVLATLAAFLKEVPGRAVISENGPPNSAWGRLTAKDSEPFGLSRAYAVLEYLAKRQGLDKKRFSISAASTVPHEGFESSDAGAKFERVVEIVLLERSTYN